MKPLLVEFVGLPAAGKSYLTALTESKLRDSGVRSSKRTYSATHGRSRASELGVKARLVSRFVLRYPVEAGRMWREVRATQQPSSLASARLWFTWMFTRSVTTTAVAVELLDQGEFQNSWSLALESRRHDIADHLEGLPTRSRPDLVIHVRVDDEEIIERLDARPGRASRLERAAASDRAELVERGGELLDEVTQVAAQLEIPVVVVDAGNDDDSGVAVAEICDAIFQLSRDSSEPIRVDHVITGMHTGVVAQEALHSSALAAKSAYDLRVIVGGGQTSTKELCADSLESGAVVTTVPTLTDRFQPLSDCKALLRIVQLFREDQPHIVHTYGTKAGVLGRLAAWAVGAPVVLHTMHRRTVHEYLSPVERAGRVALERVSARVTTRLVVVSESERSRGIAARIGRPDQYVVIPAGIDTGSLRAVVGRRADARERLDLDSDIQVVGAVARLSEQKDPLTLLEAVTSMEARGRRVVLVFVGDGPLYHELQSRIQELGLEDSVRLLGARSDVVDVLPAFDVVAHVSLWEALPRSIVQSMAVGLPVVATDVDGVGEIVQDGKTGLLTAARDSSALSVAIERMLDDADLRDACIEAGRERAAGWDSTVTVAMLDELYGQLTYW